MSDYSEELQEMATGCEFFADAYAAEDAPFPDRMPTREKLCEYLQEMSRLAHKVLSEHREMELAKRLYAIEESFRAGWNACEFDHERKSTVNGQWYKYRRSIGLCP